MTGALVAREFASLWGYYLFHAFWQASLAAVVVITLVKVCRFLPSNMRYGMLIVALLKFSLPFMPLLSVGVFNSIQSVSKTIPALRDISNLASQVAQSSWFYPLTAIYVLGLLIAAISLWRQQQRLHAIRHGGTEIHSGELSEVFVELARALKFRRPPRLITSVATTVPFAFGLRTGVVVLPSIAVERISTDELRPVLAHELAHLRHWDPWVNWLQAVLGVVWWFNPFYHLLSKVIREVREECRDDAVLAANLSSSQDYSLSMLAVAALARPQSQPNIALHSSGHKLHPLAGRLARIADPSIPRQARLTAPQLCLLMLCALVILPGLALSRRTDLGERYEATEGKGVQFETRPIDEHGSHHDHQESHRRAHNHH
jgi:beta-lactamase regulating signal transducer with metallopeptidase domain